jgi:hypothetical protein
MKNINIYCLIGYTLLFSSIIMNLLNDKKDIFIKFMKSLNYEQSKKYSDIVYERYTIYITGMMIGLILGLYYLYNYPKDKYRICKFLSIVFTVKLGFYKIYPKSTLMLYHLTEKNQVNLWADIYLNMKKTWIHSIIISIIGYLLISNYS